MVIDVNIVIEIMVVDLNNNNLEIQLCYVMFVPSCNGNLKFKHVLKY